MFTIFIIYVVVASIVATSLTEQNYLARKGLKQTIFVTALWPMWFVLLIVVAFLVLIVNFTSRVLSWADVFPH